MTPKKVNIDVWQGQGRRLFGDNVALWKFRCPSCGHVQSALDYRSYNVPTRAIDLRLGYSCIGVTIKHEHPHLEVVGFMEEDLGYGCTYEGGGEIQIAPTLVVYGISRETKEPAIRPTFAWAD